MSKRDKKIENLLASLKLQRMALRVKLREKNIFMTIEWVMTSQRELETIERRIEKMERDSK